ncbi:uncharacterized protein BJX67DRAFT_240266 [Aspergillus lucknowensis]|uniref:Transmembrane protein n=1 Tax=Aspergillus lucknowensis TaxID=176173 RepID=A0ABR4LGH8_9EURO
MMLPRSQTALSSSLGWRGCCWKNGLLPLISPPRRLRDSLHLALSSSSLSSSLFPSASSLPIAFSILFRSLLILFVFSPVFPLLFVASGSSHNFLHAHPPLDHVLLALSPTAAIVRRPFPFLNRPLNRF